MPGLKSKREPEERRHARDSQAHDWIRGSEQRFGCCFVICSGCALSVPPLVLVEGVFADFVGGSLAEAGHARSKEPEGV